jgi:hypothetical protein
MDNLSKQIMAEKENVEMVLLGFAQVMDEGFVCGYVSSIVIRYRLG